MISLGIVVAVIVFIVVIARSRRFTTGPHKSEPMPSGELPVDAHSMRLDPATLRQKLDSWVNAGLISQRESQDILKHETSEPAELVHPPEIPEDTGVRRVPATAEALGYLGGVLVTVALVLVATRYWSDVSAATRLALTGAVTAALIGAGVAVRETADPALARFRWFLWLASSATSTLFGVIISREQFNASTNSVILTASLFATVESAILWGFRNRPLQQGVALVGLEFVVGSFAATIFLHSPAGPIGLAVWIVSLAYLAAGLRRLTPDPYLTETIGAIGIVVGSTVISVGWQSSGGPLFQLASVAGLIILSQVRELLPFRQDQLIVGIVGGIGAFEMFPASLLYYARDAGILTGALTWIAGVVLVWVGSEKISRSPTLAKFIGGLFLLGGAALTGIQSQDVAPIFGLATAIGLVILGTRPGQVLMSAMGSFGVLIFVTWGVSWFFPSQGRAPLLLLIAGILVIAIAIWMARNRGRFVSELGLRNQQDKPTDNTPEHAGDSKSDSSA